MNINEGYDPTFWGGVETGTATGESGTVGGTCLSARSKSPAFTSISEVKSDEKAVLRWISPPLPHFL